MLGPLVYLYTFDGSKTPLCTSTKGHFENVCTYILLLRHVVVYMRAPAHPMSRHMPSFARDKVEIAMSHTRD